MTQHTRRALWLCIYLLLAIGTYAQNVRNDLNPYLNNDKKGGFQSDSVETTDVPEGIYAWHIGSRFGDIRPADYDTIPHRFQNENQTMGETAHYNFTGNLGAPRLSHYFNEQGANMQTHPFIFTLPYDFALTSTEELLFTNTKSPFTNLTYHSCGNKTNGEDRLKALFSVNSGKKLGFGFKADYLYGRGYYTGQSTAHFDGTLFASYRSDQYQMHAYVKHVYLKNRENGGIESDDYVNRPETFPTSYGTADMPINLAHAWNKIGSNEVYLTHKYSVGFHRYRDAKGNLVKDVDELLRQRQQKLDSERAEKLAAAEAAKAKANAESNMPVVNDSTQLAKATPTPRIPRQPGEEQKETRNEALDSLKITTEFVPVSSFIHTFKFNDNKRRFFSNESNTESNPGYFTDFYLSGENALDCMHHVGVENTLAMELHEGMNKWMKMGLRLYGKHELARFDFTAPNIAEAASKTKFTENYITVGAQILSQQNKFIRYNVLGELRTTGTDWGEFNVEGDAVLSIPIKKDSLQLLINGFVRNERPSFYYRHFYARNAWWDNTDLNKMFHARVNATLRWKDTRLTASLENIQNYTYFKESLTEVAGSSSTYATYRHAVSVEQASKNVQLLGLTLNQDFHWGIFHWENEFTYQVSSNKDVLPVPAFSAYSNVYLLFRIAKVLKTELGVDASYFTRYTAPTYSPIVGQYAVQDEAYATQIGNYPIVNAYVNFHLKRTRFYLKASHLNYSSGAGRPFLVAHYPLNRMTIHLGISWNFVN